MAAMARSFSYKDDLLTWVFGILLGLAVIAFFLCMLNLGALVHESELARNEPDSQVHHLPRTYDDGLPSSAIRLRM